MTGVWACTKRSRLKGSTIPRRLARQALGRQEREAWAKVVRATGAFLE